MAPVHRLDPWSIVGDHCKKLRVPLCLAALATCVVVAGLLLLLTLARNSHTQSSIEATPMLAAAVNDSLPSTAVESTRNLSTTRVPSATSEKRGLRAKQSQLGLKMLRDLMELTRILKQPNAKQSAEDTFNYTSQTDSDQAKNGTGTEETAIATTRDGQELVGIEESGANDTNWRQVLARLLSGQD